MCEQPFANPRWHYDTSRSSLQAGTPDKGELSRIPADFGNVAARRMHHLMIKKGTIPHGDGACIINKAASITGNADASRR